MLFILIPNNGVYHNVSFRQAIVGHLLILYIINPVIDNIKSRE